MRQGFLHSGLVHRWPQRGRSCVAAVALPHRGSAARWSAQAARPQRSEERSAFCKGNQLYKAFAKALPGRAERRTTSIYAPSKRLLPWQQPRPLRGQSDGGSRAASAAPKAAQQKKPPERYKRHLSEDFLVKASPRRRAPVLYHTFPASSIPPPPRQRAGPPHGEGGGWGSPTLPRSPPRRRCAASRRQLKRSKK